MITLYTKSTPVCPKCVAAKKWLTENGIQFEERDVQASPANREFVTSRGHTTVPQFYYGETLLFEGGYDTLETMTPADLRAKVDEAALALVQPADGVDPVPTVEDETAADEQQAD